MNPPWIVDVYLSFSELAAFTLDNEIIPRFWLCGRINMYPESKYLNSGTYATGN